MLLCYEPGAFPRIQDAVIPAVFKPESILRKPSVWRRAGFPLKTCGNDGLGAWLHLPPLIE